MAFHSFVAGERPTAAQWNDWLGRRVIADCTSSTRPSSPVEGEPIFETDTDRLLLYDGSAWQQAGQLGAWTTFTPTWTGATTNPAIGNGTLSGRYLRLFGRTYLTQFFILAGSTTTFGTGQWSLSLPSALTATTYAVGNVYYNNSSTAWHGLCLVSGASAYLYSPTASGDVRLAVTTSTVPAAWASTHYLVVSVVVETST